ncbi:hypothetical protein [Shewanella woodyi]|uniref:hypothetical protein n=1 Tax=Shewanella woodyi TaxID=60961 RepID=UPI0007F9708F|nr:hypothetical protein [Shewanella woodyi]
MNKSDTKVTDLSAEQEKSVIETKEVLASKQDVLIKIGQIQAFNFTAKLLTVSELKLLKEVKESKTYKGLTYINDKGEVLTVSTWVECCEHILKSSRQHIDDKLINLQQFGNEFFEASQNMGLGYRDLRKLRQLPEQEQALVIDSDAIDMGDKDAVKELIEELTEKHAKEQHDLNQELSECKAIAKARQNLIIKTNNQLAEQTEEFEKQQLAQRQNPLSWLTQVKEINLLSTRLLTAACESASQLLELNETIITSHMNEAHSEQAMELMASVQLHNVNELFMVANNLSYETRDRFSAYIENARPMHSEEEIIELEQQLLAQD